jgi:hypothetical protein
MKLPRSASPGAKKNLFLQAFSSLGVFLGSLLFMIIAAQVVVAFTAPSANPPGSNTNPPLTTSSSPTQNYLSKFTGSNSIGNSIIYDSDTNIGISQSSPGARLTVNNPTNIGKVGSSGDGIYVYANSLNAALSAEQGNSGGWAGYFSGKVNVDGTISASDFSCSNCLGSGDIGSGAIGSSELASNSVYSAEIATDAVGTSEILNGTIQEIDLEVTNSPINNYILSYDSGTAGFTWVQDQTGSGGDNLGNHKATQHLNMNGNQIRDAGALFLGGFDAGLKRIGGQLLLETSSGVSLIISSGEGAVSLTPNLNMNNYKINNLGTPTAASDAATKQYVDDSTAGGGNEPVMKGNRCGAYNPGCTTTASCPSGKTVRSAGQGTAVHTNPDAYSLAAARASSNMSYSGICIGSTSCSSTINNNGTAFSAAHVIILCY